MEFISLDIKPWNILIRTKNHNYLIKKTYYMNKEELESYYNIAEKTRIYFSRHKKARIVYPDHKIPRMTISFYRAKDNSFLKSSAYIYHYKEITNEELLELGCSF